MTIERVKFGLKAESGLLVRMHFPNCTIKPFANFAIRYDVGGIAEFIALFLLCDLATFLELDKVNENGRKGVNHFRSILQLFHLQRIKCQYNKNAHNSTY